MLGENWEYGLIPSLFWMHCNIRSTSSHFSLHKFSTHHQKTVTPFRIYIVIWFWLCFSVQNILKAGSKVDWYYEHHWHDCCFLWCYISGEKHIVMALHFDSTLWSFTNFCSISSILKIHKISFSCWNVASGFVLAPKYNNLKVRINTNKHKFNTWW